MEECILADIHSCLNNQKGKKVKTKGNRFSCWQWATRPTQSFMGPKRLGWCISPYDMVGLKMLGTVIMCALTFNAIEAQAKSDPARSETM